MKSEESFEMLLKRLHAGDEDAAARVFSHFAGRLIALARNRLPPSLRAKLDPEDVLQSVFRSFFAHNRARPFDLENWDSLWGLLTAMTLHKCGSRLEYYHAGCRTVRLEVGLSPEDGSQNTLPIPSQEPTPEEAVVLSDLLDALMRPLEERDRKILELHLQGFSQLEISDQVGRAERTVRRTLERVRNRLRRMQDDSGRPEFNE